MDWCDLLNTSRLILSILESNETFDRRKTQPLHFETNALEHKQNKRLLNCNKVQ